MKEVAKYHRISNLRNAHGRDEKWLSIDCGFIESGVSYANENGCRRIVFRLPDDKKKANKVGIDILERFANLEGIIWHLPIKKETNLSALMAHGNLKYLSIIEPNLAIDLASFPVLEYLDIFFSEDITGFDKASKFLRHIRVSGLSADLRFLGAVKNLIKLTLVRSKTESLSGIQEIAKLEELSMMHCRNLSDISHAAKLKNLHTMSIEGSNRMSDFSAVQDFKALRTLWLKTKKIESCRFISAMKSISFVSINAVIADNDLSPLVESKTLEEVWFDPNKKSYSPKFSPDEVNAILDSRNN